ncbi:hypothetical protein GQ55_5G272500 [Panicum hallii var. hallii]|uniref:Secreted protein n=2 Tax=Panicum hallii TaxID=206008 RepID=A0A2T7DKN4_9POAL|nr:hypothetical protein GQ55_5G272500 [Panicum hallii var. hallii]PVH38493.1 hypothetical protein PAHAL_5G271600 [Panicum hallii]
MQDLMPLVLFLLHSVQLEDAPDVRSRSILSDGTWPSCCAAPNSRWTRCLTGCRAQLQFKPPVAFRFYGEALNNCAD